MGFFERLARAWNVLWGLKEPPAREAFAPSPPPPPPAGIGRTITPSGARPPIIRERPRPATEESKEPDGILVRLIVDYKGERISIPVIFDGEAISETLPLAPATLAAGSGMSEEEILAEVVAEVPSRGTPPTHFSMNHFQQVHGGTLLFGAAAHVNAHLPFAIPHMPRVMGEVWFLQGRAVFSARKGMSTTGLVVEVSGKDPAPFNANSAALPIPPDGILVRQAIGIDKARGFAPVPSAIAWEIVPRYV
jgi:hypothetical protein